MDNTRLKFLFERYTMGSCTEEERTELLHFLAQSPHDPLLHRLMKDLWDNDKVPGKQSPELDSARTGAILHAILKEEKKIVPRPTRSVSFIFSRVAAVLVVLILAIMGGYYGVLHKPQREAVISKVSSDTEHKFIKLPD